MCGISGIVNISGNPVDIGVIERMTTLVAHRGPDDSGIYCDKNLALGHRRLSIIDLSAASAQPMKYQDKYVIVYNGEIYNYIEIRTELQSHGYHFKTSGDTEVLLAAYDMWGDQCVSRFNGMWSFCIYDIAANKLFCSRDRFGVKPFYYVLNADSFRFGSEIKQVLDPDVQQVVNMKVLANYLVMGLEEYDEQTFFNGILRLKPGHNLYFDIGNSQVTTKAYYEINCDDTVAELSLEESTKLFLSELKRSVTYRLRSDVKVGTCLSGGLDSSMIAALASDLYHQSSSSKFTAITATSIDSANDESLYAQAVVKNSNIDWHTTTPSTADFLNSIDEVIKLQEEPFGSPSVFMQYFVMKKAKESGCPVLLDGQGGDETLLGYQRYYPSYLLSLRGFKKLSGLMSSAANSGMSFGQLVKGYFYFTNGRLRLNRQKMRLGFLKSEFTDLVDEKLVYSIASTYSHIRNLQKLELSSTQLPHLLRYEDKNSMHFSIETRLPFLDYKLVELSLSLNNSYKIRDGYSKYILRKASEGYLPKDISWRKNKIGFEAPSSKWLKDDAFMYEAIKKSAILTSVLSELPDLTDDKIILWRLYNIAKWEEVFNVGKS